MPADATATRAKLLDAACEAFAQHGIDQASLVDIARRAGQRNRGALHYHFGSREGALAAVLDRHAPFLVERGRQLVAEAVRKPGVQPLVEAIVRPTAELAESGEQGRCCLRILCELTELDPIRRGPELDRPLAVIGADAVYAVLAERLPPMPESVRGERLALVTEFILRAVADRARMLGQSSGGRQRLDREPFIANLVTMATAALIADPG